METLPYLKSIVLAGISWVLALEVATLSEEELVPGEMEVEGWVTEVVVHVLCLKIQTEVKEPLVWSHRYDSQHGRW